MDSFRLNIFLICFLFNVNTIYSKCTINFPSAIVYMPVGDDKMMLNKGESVEINENEFVDAFCASGFRRENTRNYYDERPKANTFTIRITCPFPRDYNHQYTSYLCDNNDASFFEYDSTYCNYINVVYGFEIFETPIVLAEFCYNFNFDETVLVHYIHGRKSKSLQYQFKYNPIDAKENISFDEPAVFSSKTNYDINLKTSVANMNENLEKYSLNIAYIVGELVSRNSFVGSFMPYTDSRLIPNLVVWWDPLFSNNWKRYTSLLDIESEHKRMEVFAGTSGTIEYSLFGDCIVKKKLRYNFHSMNKNVPLYIWNYVKSLDEPDAPEVVVIGVNSPFLDVNDNSTVLCKSVCSEIKWLKELEYTRKFAAYGFVFCCKPDEVKHLLDNFPIIDEPKNLPIDQKNTDVLQVHN